MLQKDLPSAPLSAISTASFKRCGGGVARAYETNLGGEDTTDLLYHRVVCFEGRELLNYYITFKRMLSFTHASI